jgi:hypothetical protein
MVKKLVVKFGLSEAKTKSTPLALGINLVKAKEDEVLDKTQYPYGELVGSMMYLAVCTRPDIAHAVGVLARYMSTPSMEHWKTAKAVLRYVAGSASVGIKFGSTGSRKGSTGLVGYCDSDFAGDLDSRRSTTGYVFLLNGGVVSWNSRLVATPLWPSVGVKPNTWKSWRLGVFWDSRMFRARQQGGKTPRIGVFVVSLESS